MRGFEHHAWAEFGVGDALAGLERILKIVYLHALASSNPQVKQAGRFRALAQQDFLRVLVSLTPQKAPKVE